MDDKQKVNKLPEPQITVEEINRVLEVGRILLTVLTPEELDHLKQLFQDRAKEKK